MYEYRAFVTKVYDGDTLTVDIDLGFGVVMKKQKLRLKGVNTPEIRGGTAETKEAGLKARDFVRGLVLDRNVILKTFKDKGGKYGRWLAKVHPLNEHGESTTDIATLLLREGLAVEYM